ncbi:unnamed protein product, partial [Mesorhabditis spiculigera]
MVIERFNFPTLHHTQKMAVYRKLGFIEKFDLRQASKYSGVGSSNLSMSELSNDSKMSLSITQGHPSLLLKYDEYVGPEDDLARSYEAEVPIPSPEFLFDFLNRLTRPLPPQAYEVKEYAHTLRPGGARPLEALDIFRGSFYTEYSHTGPSEMVPRLQAARLRPRQPDRIKLMFGNGRQIEAEPEDGSPGYGRVLEEVLHIPRVNLSLYYWRTDAWEEAIDTLLVLLDAALHRPIGEAARFLHISIEFASFDPPGLLAKFKLPDRLFAYLQRPDIPSRGVVRISSGDDIIVPDSDTRVVQFLVTVAQNSGDTQLHAELPPPWIYEDLDYKLEWPTGGN